MTEIERFMLEEIAAGRQAVTASAAAAFGISRQATASQIARLIKRGFVRAEGIGRGRKYSLVILKTASWLFALKSLREDLVWRNSIAPLVSDLPENVEGAWHYGITEMVNNAIDHSQGTTLHIRFSRTALATAIEISDDGEGIFKRIRRILKLDDEREAILELAKGKLTTDPSGHSGEGIFFTSKVMDRFVIMSGALFFAHNAEDDNDVLLDGGYGEQDWDGTTVKLELKNEQARTLKQVMDKFAEPDEFSFSKTIVPVRLARHEGEKLVSRSQAKRLVARFEKFKSVALDFTDVQQIGQAFADEVFRVFATAHPDVMLTTLHTSKDVKAMIKRAKSVV